jgi:hypothetical protein
MKRKKRKFSYPERYAIWLKHGQRCWRCTEPLRLYEVTIDHVFPESLLDDDDKRQEILRTWGLPASFNIDSFENWLPCHARCNQMKGNALPHFVPATRAILDKVINEAHEVKIIAESVSRNATKDKVLSVLFAAFESKALSLHDITDLIRSFVENPTSSGVPDNVIILDTGYWIKLSDIVKEGLCRCERDRCVGHDFKMHCFFTSDLSPWVLEAGLYWKCYDEVIICPRCSRRHKRGHVGLKGICGQPYRDQRAHCD